ncbi:hypothetical protein WOLCODRAFT_95398 [Wolfiporia cocos MD-104 SS10]|uniref:Dbl homology domain-containing protein n=1 Tax=Wolfiporia cocos (strain MD-104) TaxID=742152 RepID=A0A2H3IXF5_WOLCO|nr:hypothetical protein WOLCODRAFT_95398 [Wolfiporia cocos MD-104 SS10]
MPAVTPAVIRNATRSPRHRPSSLDISRRAVRKAHMRPIDEQREAKRRKVINEFHETEKSYVDGLDLIYSHFLTPLIASLDTPNQLLDRSELTSVFSNFIDIWNLHHSFYAALTAFLDNSLTSQPGKVPPPLSPVLLAHFPYLSMYTPFVTSFSDALASYASLLHTHHAFASFIARQEEDPRCGKLKFRDWLLTIVQRCPRYLLLLKDLIGCTDPDDPEYSQLTAVHTLVSKITSSLNASLHTHAQTLALLALQRNTANLPFRLITPGRTFLKRAPLLQLEGNAPREREFLLFSDCILWLASADGDAWEPAVSVGVGMGELSLSRSRSKSDADTFIGPNALRRRESVLRFRLGGPRWKVRNASTGADERWVYKGFVDLVDLEVVVSPVGEPGEERRFELLSPTQSFAVYAASEEERDEWATAIRNAKAALLVSLNVMQPNSTLTSSESTHHLRRTLQALPYAPDEGGQKPSRGKVDHFVPAIWIPDGKTQSCMRCGRTFGWRRRRHHCRLCGRCVCGSCSGKTFYILGDNAKDAQKPARACDACYETVFPLLDTPTDPATAAGTTHSHLTLSGLKSMPSLVISDKGTSPSALMVVDLESPRRVLRRIDDEPSVAEALESGPSVPAIRVKSPSRPKSYIQLLEEFQEHGLPVSDVAPDERDEEEEQEVLTEDTHRAEGSSLPPTPRRESTARRHKRFSLPAIALQTNAVTARPNVVGEGPARRFSLVLSRGTMRAEEKGGQAQGSHVGLAAGKLSELLGRMHMRGS